MDRPSPTSIRYSYSNSSYSANSIGISRSLERSGMLNSTSPTRNGVYDYATGNNNNNNPNIEQPPQSAQTLAAQSSSIPSNYMEESSNIEVNRTINISTQQSHPIRTTTNGANNNQSIQGQSRPPGSLTAMDRQTYQLQIQQLKLLLNQQNKQVAKKQELEAKYQRCIQQMNELFRQNDELRTVLDNKKYSDHGSIEISKEYGEGMKNSQINKTKHQQIRRLKDSILVLQQEKDSYQDETNQLLVKMNQMEHKNEEYENKLVLVSHELQRINRINKQRNQQKNKLARQNEKLSGEIIHLRLQLEKISHMSVAQSDQRSIQFGRKIEEQYKQLQRINRLKLQFQTENRKLTNELKTKQQDYIIQIQKYKLESSTARRQIQDLQAKNTRLELELKNLHDKNSSSQMQLSNVSTQTRQLQIIIRQLQQKLRTIEREYLLQVQKLQNLNLQNAQLRNKLRNSEEQIRKAQAQSERHEQQTIQLRRKIQQISISSERQNLGFEQSVRQRQIIIKQFESRLRDSQGRARQYLQLSKKVESTNKQLQLRLQQMEYKMKEMQKVYIELNTQNQRLQSSIRDRDSNETNLQKVLKEYELKNISIHSELQKLQTIHNSLITQKTVDQSKLRDQFVAQLNDLQNRFNNSNLQKIQFQNRYEQQIKQTNRIQNELQNNKHTRMQMQNKVKVLQSALQSQRQQFAFLQQSHTSLQNQLKIQITNTRQISFKLSKDSESLKSQYFEQISKKDAHMLELQQKMLEQQSSISTLNMKVQQKDNIITDYLTQVQKYKQQSYHSDQQLQNIKIDYSHISQQLQFLKQSNTNKQKSLLQTKDQLTASLTQKEQKLNQKNEQVRKIQNEYNGLVQKYRHLQNEYHSMKEQIIRIQSDQNNLNQRYKIVERQYKETLNNYKIKQKQNYQLKAAVQRNQDKFRNQQREYNQVVINLNRLQQRNKILQREYTMSTASLSERQKIIQKQYNESKGTIYKLQQKLRNSQLQYRQLQHQSQILTTRSQDVTKLLQTHYKPMEVQYRQLELHVKQVQGKNRQQQQISRQLQFTIQQLQLKDKNLQQQYEQLQQKYRQSQLQCREFEQQCRQLQHQCRQIQQQLSQSRIDSQKLQQKTIHIQQQSHETYSQIQQKQMRAEQQIQNYKDTISNLSAKYRTLELEYSNSKESLGQLQIRYAQIQTKSNLLESQLKMLQQHYTEIITNHKDVEEELLRLRQILSKTQQERYFIQQQKEQQSIYFAEQIKMKQEIVQNISKQLDNRMRQLHQLNDQSNSRLISIQQNTVHKTQQYEQKIRNLQNQIHNISQNHRRESDKSYQQITNLHGQNSALKQQLHREQYNSENIIKNLHRQLNQKDNNMKQMQFSMNSYMDKVNILTTEINNMSEQFSNSRFVQHQQLENIVQAKNIKIQELQKELIQREEFYRREINALQAHSERIMTERVSHLQLNSTQKQRQAEQIIRILRTQLEQQSQKYQQLIIKLQSILHTNEQHFQQILHYLQKILQINTELILSISKSNTNMINLSNNQAAVSEQNQQRYMQELGHFRNESFQALGQLKNIISREGEDHRMRSENEQTRRLNKQRNDRKQKQQTLQREQRIIKYLQEQKQRSRNDKDRDERKFKQLQQKIEQHSRKNMQNLQNLAQNINHTIRQQMSSTIKFNNNILNAQQYHTKERQRQTQQNIIRQNRNANKHLHEITNNIMGKMENLTNLLLQNNQEYKNSVAFLQENIEKLQKNNEKLEKQVQTHRHNQIILVSKHQEQKFMMQTKFRQELNNFSHLQHKTNISQNESDHLRKQINMLSSQLERNHIESAQMRKQYDMIVTQFERTNNSLNVELDLARKQIQRLSNKAKQKQEEYYRHMSSSSARNPTKNSTISLNSNKSPSFQNLQNKTQVMSIVSKYEQRINQLSQQIQRLHRVIDNNQQQIIAIERQRDMRANSKGYIAEQANPKLQKQLIQLRQALIKKNSEVQVIKAKLQILQSQGQQNTQRSPNDSYQFQVLEVKHKLSVAQQQNVNLHAQIDKSMKTIQNLTQKIETMGKSYKDMTQYAQHIENKVVELYGKYNKDLLNKNSFEQSNQKINQNMINRLQNECKALKEKLNESQNRNDELKQQFSKMENIIEGLRFDNLQLRKKNYEYEVQFQKISFMQLKIGKLSNQMDRISQINVQLNQQVSECRFAIGDESTYERRLFESYLTIVLMAAQIQALRLRVKEDSRAGSRSNSVQKRQFQNEDRSRLARVMSDEGTFRMKSNIQINQLDRPKSKSKSKNNLQYTFEKFNEQDARKRSTYINLNQKRGHISLNEIPVHGSILIPKPNKHIDPQLSNMLRRSPSRDKSGVRNSTKRYY